ncbi:Clp amino terminal domain-containing protein, pathogenicity island component [Geodermatophilus pulveris]|uniref:Clp amino terminal domain-containing protein, pathogenicity island component n=1 Tax=Geodermatophilus pulveris TaxID=1564159 RepID=A0A239IL63_9ACTN|nr:Clp protease N-terminal domain-containing protein [Geodermatophilus pulveris]SNS94506.1 Clp amino terminal domain-containing protein, pathogenicity island component [Geodermatophilus pulveris]
MFDRFTAEARQVVVSAQEEARTLRHDSVGTEHLLLALLGQDTPAAVVLGRYGLTRDGVAAAVRQRAGGGDLDADALRTLGIDLDAVRDVVEAAFGPGALEARRGGQRAGRAHLRFTPGAKKALELSLREALALRHDRITDTHVLLGLLREDRGPAAEVLRARGVDLTALRRDLVAALAA